MVYKTYEEFKNDILDYKEDPLTILIDSGKVKERTFSYYTTESGDVIGDESDEQSVIETVIDNLDYASLKEIFKISIEELE